MQSLGRTGDEAGATVRERRHMVGRERCPYLPEVAEVLTAAATRSLAGDYGARFYHAALRYAQSLWLEGKPAQQ